MGHLLSSSGSLAAAISHLGGPFTAPNLDAARIAAAFGPVYRETPFLLEEAMHGVIPAIPLGVPTNLPVRLGRPNHASARLAPEAIVDRLTTDLCKGRVFAIPVHQAHLVPFLRPSPLGAVERKGKVRVIHDLSHGGLMPDGHPDWSVNSLTDPSSIPECDIGSIFLDYLRRIYQLRLRYPSAHLVLAKMDVTDAFRHLPINPVHAPLYSYRWGDLVVIELRLGFGWTGAPGHFFRWQRSIGAKMDATRPSDMTSERTDRLVLLPSLVIEEPPTSPPASVPLDPAFPLAAVAHGDAPFEARSFLDDTLAAEVNHEGRPWAASAALEEAHYDLYGWCGADVVKPAKRTSWASRQEILGLNVDAHDMTTSLPEDKSQEMHGLLFEHFHRARQHATPREVMQLVGKLRCYAYCLRPGRYYLRRLINMAQRGQGLDLPMKLDEEFHRDMDMWRELVGDPELRASNYSTPLYNHLKQTPEVMVIGDAMAEAGGGFIVGQGVHEAAWWRVRWPVEVVQRFHRTSQKLEPRPTMVTIAHLELATLVIGVATMLEVTSGCVGRAVLALADNTNAVSWARKAGAKDARAAALVRLLGVMEAKRRFSLATRHIAGLDNEESDFISRHEEEEILDYFSNHPPPALASVWRQVQPAATFTLTVLMILGSTTSEPASPPAQATPMTPTGGPGSGTVQAEACPRGCMDLMQGSGSGPSPISC
jgi:hypothetical protein